MCHRYEARVQDQLGRGRGLRLSGARLELTLNSLTEAGFYLPEPCLEPHSDLPIAESQGYYEIIYTLVSTTKGCQSNKQNISFGKLENILLSFYYKWIIIIRSDEKYSGKFVFLSLSDGGA